MTFSLGSSPRVRGSHMPRVSATSFIGIIPAGAGLTNDFLLLNQNKRDHPRGCGAHPIDKSLRAARAGSSPRVRGSRWIKKSMKNASGIIPAGAGLTRA